ncbi:MAG: glycoside hydrolase/phage tail family protein [Rhizobiaceae bacterium]
MATILLQAAGSALGTQLFGPTAGIFGRALGALAGSYIDQQLFGSANQTITGPRLETAQVLSSREGIAIPNAFGRARIAGEVIWATRFEEVQSTETQSQGGKGGGGSKTTTISYAYFGNFAVGLCEGEIAHIGRIWADGQLLEQTQHTIRRYTGSESQQADSLIEAKQGAGNAPAYRGLAYLVFEHFPLEEFGNRIPQIAVEVIRPVGALEQKLYAVNMIPGATEFGYDTEPVIEATSEVENNRLNTHQTLAETDFLASLDELLALCPNLHQIALVITWFGDDLRAEHCQIRPKVEVASRDIVQGPEWKVAGLSRGAVELVSCFDGNPAYGGTPSDGSVIRAIQAIRERGIKVCLNPFMMMDVPQDNGLPDPYGGSQQADYPWRGRITCDPAPMQPGTPDGTAAARQQVDAFVGAAQASQFVQKQDGVDHIGISDWGYRRLVLHYAHLAEAAGGVDMFLIGSEMRGLTSVRGENDTFPFVEALQDLADDVAGIVNPDCLITYGADWSEYFGYQPADASNNVYYNLDPLWASSSVGAVGIDNYMPLSDWRSTGAPDGEGRTASDPDMLARQVAGGEGYDWYYASAADRELGLRTPITDGLGKPWTFRYKDLISWWQNSHYDRRNGSELASPSPWLVQSKPILFTELGCPAVNNGAGQPNVFVDPKSAESLLPYFSNGGRNDQMQSAYIEAHQQHWLGGGGEGGGGEGGENPNNPVSIHYGEPMVDFQRAQFWAWDARPYPTFPSEVNLWSDAPNWQLGHWLNGRLGMVRLADLLAEILIANGITTFDTRHVTGIVDGYVLAETTSSRQALEVLISLFQLSVFEDSGVVHFRSPGIDPVTVLTLDDIVHEAAAAAVFTHVTEQESDLPISVQLAHIDPHFDFQETESSASRNNRDHLRQQSMAAPVVIGRDCASPVLEAWLHARWTARDTITFGLSRAHSHLTLGDVIAFTDEGLAQTWRIVSLETGESLLITAQAVELVEFEASAEWTGQARQSTNFGFGKPLCRFMDLPDLPHIDGGGGNCLAVAAHPWPGEMALYAAPGNEGYAYQQSIVNAGYLGVLESELPASTVVSRRDNGSQLRIKLHQGTIASLASELVFNGGNALAVESRAGTYEILQFQQAELVGDKTYDLSRLLRGQAGTETEAALGAAAGANVVVLNQAVVNLSGEDNLRGLETNWLTGPVGKALDGPEFTQSTFTPGYRSLLPYAPVHLRAEVDSANNVTLSWIRRDRINSDDWTAVEIPLSEATESYRVIITADAPGSIDITVSTPQLQLTGGELTAAFGAIPASLTIEVAQLSATVGQGPAAFLSISL